MDIQSRLDTLIHYIRRSRRRISASAFFIALIALILFISGSYYFLFFYYEKITQQYYESLMRNVSIFQQSIIRKESYWEDLKNICTSLKTNKGLIDVWCTDRFGKLIYHTDENVYNEYKSKRLSSDYYESINHIWEFQDGYPVVNRQQPHSLIVYRLSIPIYAFGEELHDFVLGMDVKRFILLPEKTSRILIFIIGYVVVSIVLLYVPLFLWFRSRFTKMISQTRLVIGTIQIDAKKTAPSEAVHEPEERAPVPVETDHADVEAPAERRAIIQEEEVEEWVEKEIQPARETKEPSEEAPVEEEEKVYEPAIAAIKEGETAEEMIEERLRTNPLILLMDKKGDLFRKQDVDLSFIQVSSFVYHSKSSNGSYLSYYQNNSNHLYTIFSYPDVNPKFAADQLTSITEHFRSWEDTEPSIKNILKTVNTYCLENNLHIDASCVLIKEDDKKVDYSSCGKGQAIYVKKEEDIVKDLNLDLVALGILTDEQFEEAFSYAEIDFVGGDVFILLPQNAPEIMVEEESLLYLIKHIVLEKRQLSAREISDEINIKINEFRKRERKIPETGFAVFKFL